MNRNEMHINYYNLSKLNDIEIEKLLVRKEFDLSEVCSQVKNVVDDVKINGVDAVIKYTEKFDKVKLAPDKIRVSQEEIEEAKADLPSHMMEVIEHSARNIRTFHTKQMPEQYWWTEVEHGVMAGEKVTPITSVGIYVPRGKGSFANIVLRLGIPAVVAGVKKIIICTPPTTDGRADAATLVAADMIGITEIFKVGGAQSIAAMAYGVESVTPKVDKIVGPGSPYVSAAKQLLFGAVDVGIPAGISEAIILADENADPRVVARDMLIEGEHGPDTPVILLTWSEQVIEEVKKYLAEFIEELPEISKEYCKKGLTSYGGIILAGDQEAAIDFVNKYAPEHIEILTQNPFDVMTKINNAGEILLGEFTPVSIGNYTLGPTAVLPTGRGARTFSGMSIFDFVKRTSLGYVSKEGFATLKGTTAKFAEHAGLFAHAWAVSKRGL